MKSILSIFLLFISIQVYSQAIQEAKNFKLSEPQTTTAHYKARDYIEMLPGFSVDATTGITFIAEVDPNIIVPVNYDEPILPWSDELSVGSISGQANVNQLGAATYQIPIDIPLGTNSLVPQISILYNSLSGDGYLADKWNISGLSAISRTAENKFFDNSTDPVDFDNNDKFSLDGQRLLIVDDVNKIYTTETENFTRIQAIGTMGVGPQKFLVTTKKGNKWYTGRNLLRQVNARQIC